MPTAAKRRKKSRKSSLRRPIAVPAPVAIIDRSVEVPAKPLELRPRVAAIIVLALVTLAVYYPVIHHPFSNYDDAEYVTDNTAIQHGITLSFLRWAATSTEHANWHPVTWISHALDWKLFGPMAAGHHFTSLLLHALNVVLLFWFLTAVTKSMPRSLLVAGLFALHPMNVESVAWIAERKNLLCTFFFLLALLAYARYARRPAVGRYLLVALVFALSLASKPMVVTFPFVLLLLDYWPLQRIQGWIAPSLEFPAPQFPFWKLVLEKLPLLALSAADCVLTVIAQQKVSAIRAGAAFPLSLRLENVIFSYAAYLWKLIWPVHLAVLYPYPTGGIAAWRLAICAALVIAISILVWRRRTQPYLLTGWLWFLGVFVPVIGVIQVGEQGMADRYAYLPLIGVFLAIVWGGFDVAQAAGKRATSSAAIAAVVILAGLAGLSRRQLGFWSSNYDLWAHTAAVTENNVAAEDVAGSELLLRAMNQGLNYSSEAQVHFQRALQINPNDSEALMDVGADLQIHGKLPEALEHYQHALRYVDDDFLKGKILSDIGSAYEHMGDFNIARAYYLQGLQISPGKDNSSFLGYARTFTDEKIATLAPTVAAHPTADGYLQLGQLQDAAGYTALASASYQRALKLDSNLQAARAALDQDSKILASQSHAN